LTERRGVSGRERRGGRGADLDLALQQLAPDLGQPLPGRLMERLDRAARRAAGLGIGEEILFLDPEPVGVGAHAVLTPTTG
jgi:hypothetical protein